MALPDTQPLRGGAPLARSRRGHGLGSAALRLLNRYSFGFALLLSIALLIANLVEISRHHHRVQLVGRTDFGRT